VAMVDDIHWAEPALLDLLESVVGASDKAPILLLCTSRHDLLEKRPEWGEGEGALRIVLRPLSDDAAGTIADNLLGSTGLPADVVARIVAAAEGIPLYVEQMLSMLVDTRALELRDGRWVRTASYQDIVVPPTIKALLEARLGQLGVAERTAIEPASVIGLQFATPAVVSMAPPSIQPHVESHLQNLSRQVRFPRLREHFRIGDPSRRMIRDFRQDGAPLRGCLREGCRIGVGCALVAQRGAREQTWRDKRATYMSNRTTRRSSLHFRR